MGYSMSKDNKTFIVFGMGRSATSLIAESLHKNGVHMGERLMPGGKGNPQGHYEDLDFVELNDEILKRCGGSADNPPSQEVINNNKSFDDKAKSLVLSKDNKPLWGWKDPRTAATIKKYINNLKDPILICPFRDPLKVGESLNAIDGVSVEEGVKLAKDYNKRVIEFLTERYT